MSIVSNTVLNLVLLRSDVMRNHFTRKPVAELQVPIVIWCMHEKQPLKPLTMNGCVTNPQILECLHLPFGRGHGSANSNNFVSTGETMRDFQIGEINRTLDKFRGALLRDNSTLTSGSQFGEHALECVSDSLGQSI